MAHADRPTAAARSRGRLLTTLGLTAAFLVVEVLGALFTGSLALLADAGHMLTDVGALALALFAIWVAARPPTPAKTYGYYRAEILAALVNALVGAPAPGGQRPARGDADAPRPRGGRGGDRPRGRRAARARPARVDADVGARGDERPRGRRGRRRERPAAPRAARGPARTVRH